MKHLLTLFPFVTKIIQELEHQNKLLNKITLTGKINALDVAATLFEFTDATIKTFDTLKNELVEALLEENLKKHTTVLESKSKVAINILIRNLFERTADVGFLATDGVIIDFLTTGGIDEASMRSRLISYAKKYTVYNEIIVFDLEGNPKVNIHPTNRPLKLDDAILKEALQSDTYVERYAHFPFFSSQSRTLIYAQRILKENRSVGVLVLCFRLDDEFRRILEHLSNEYELIGVAGKEGAMSRVEKSTILQKMRYSSAAYTLLDKRQLCITSKTTGYQGYSGLDEWYGFAIARKMEPPHSRTSDETEHRRHQSKLLNDKLQSVIAKADDLVEDLSDVIINGELIASKRRVYVLSPILDNLRIVSSSLLETIKNSVDNLEYLVRTSLVDESKLASHLAIDIMDRNLYERANDCRWWALTPLFQRELSRDNPDSEALNATLHYINALYTVYTNLFLFDRNGRICAASNDRSIIGQNVPQGYLGKVLSNSNEQHYTVSSFETTPFYEAGPTYIYFATVRHKNSAVGGIGIVFDAAVEFPAMLKDSFPLNKNGFSAFIDKERRIIASSGCDLKTLETLPIEPRLLEKHTSHAYYEFITYNERPYLFSAVKSQGYREYKTEDNYRNELFAVTMIEV